VDWLSFEIQDLPDLIRIVTFIRLKKSEKVEKSTLKKWLDKICASRVCIDDADVDRTLHEMAQEGLVVIDGTWITLTSQGLKISKEWQKFFGKKEPILEIIVGIADGNTTALVVILSVFFGTLNFAATAFAAFLTLVAVAITDFSSLFLGGITEDYSDLFNLHTLIHYSVSDIPDKDERDKSLMLIQELFTLLKSDIRKSSTISSLIGGIMTFLSGFLPIAMYLYLPFPFGLIISLIIVFVMLGLFLVQYRAWRGKVKWKVTLLETIIIIGIAVIASLIFGAI
jgi:VIT1/CCC1 family predicted Fe2+/Mn2+ transporter